ncbi:hypothetical protein BDZ45DRAFT_796971 [Acephala macrosclerotiorum]|nr:hypothetical protein BDZ45DRAFT_796971 [Acephala macrosclerotiorum]
MRFDPGHENVEPEKDDERHSELRSKMAAGYSGKEVQNPEHSIDQNITAFVSLIDKYVTTGSDLAYRKAFGYLVTDSDVYDYIKTVEETLPAAMMVSVLPWINWVLQTRMVKRFLPYEKDLIGFGKLTR